MTQEMSCITKRNHVTSLDLLIEDLMVGWQGRPHETRDEIAKLLRRFGEIVLRSVSMDFAKGATRGVEQMANLIRDPDYYETKRKRRAGAKQRQADYQAQQEREYLRRRFEPTPQEVAREIDDSLRSITYYSAAITRVQTRLAELKALEAELPLPVDTSDCASDRVS